MIILFSLEWAFSPGGAAAPSSPAKIRHRRILRLAGSAAGRLAGAEICFAKVRTCAGLLHNRGFAVSKTTAEKSESKARSGFEREKPMQSFPKGKATSGLSFKSGRFSLKAKIAFGRKNLVVTMADMRRHRTRSGLLR